MGKIYDFQKSLLLVLLTLFCANGFAQNAIVGTGFSTGWGSGSCPGNASDFKYATLVTGSGPSGTYRVTSVANGTGDQYFRFGTDWGGTFAKYAITPGSDVAVTPNTTYSLNTGCTTGGAQKINVASTSYNYVFKTLNAGPSPTGTFVVFEVQGPVYSVSSVTRTPQLSGQDVTVTANTSGSINAGQAVYLRYTNNAYATSTVVQMTGSGTSFTGIIPAAINTAGANISYYVFTSGTANVAVNGSNADLYTINLNNNGGLNYSYTANPVVVASTGGTSTSASYASFANALAAINGGTIHTGTITCTVNDDYSETATAGGFSITATGTVSAPITIKRSGLGTNKPIFNAGVGTSTTTDAIIKIIGGDYITIDGFSLLESASNLTATTQVEWGIALLHASGTNGCQNNTIQNNTITLNKTNLNSFGIYSNNNHSATNIGTAESVTNNTTGPASNNRIYSNTISNVNLGIAFIGTSTAANHDLGNDIGGTSSATGNTITNWGGAATSNSYISNSSTSYCIYLNHQVGDNVSYNTITSATISGAAVSLRGIFKDYGTGATLVGITNITNNTITITDNFTSGTLECIRTQGTVAATSTLNINNNTILNTSVGGASSSTTIVGIVNSEAVGTLSMSNNIIRGTTSTATTGGFTGISNTGAVVTTINMNNNQIGNASGNAITFNAATSGALLGVSNTGGASTAILSMTGNDFRGIVHAVAGSSIHTYLNNTAATNAQNINSNTFTNLNVNTTSNVRLIVNAVTLSATGTMNINNNAIITAFNKQGNGGAFTCFSTNASSVAGSVCNMLNNNFSNITLAGSTSFVGINNTDGASSVNAPVKNINGNTFSSISNAASLSAITILNVNFGAPNSTINNNVISDIDLGNALSAITLGSSFQSLLVSGNNINGLLGNTSGVTAITSAAPTVSILKNKIFNLESTTTLVRGIEITAGTTVTIANNLIGDLRSTTGNFSTDIIRGISLTSATANSAINVYYNTIYLTGSNNSPQFNTSCIFHTSSSTATTADLTMRNNIFVNATTGTSGIRAAYKRSTSFKDNYNAASNRNLFYGDAIYSDGGGFTDFTLADYKTRMLPRDANSISENPVWQSTAGSSVDFLKFDTGIPTGIESGAANIATFTDDYSGTIRFGNPGSTSTGNAPDIGAWELNGIGLPICFGTPAVSTINGAASVCTGAGTTLSLSPAYIDLGITYQWQSSTVSGGPYTNMGTSSTQATGNLSVPMYYLCTITCTNSGLSFATSEKSVLINALPIVEINNSNPFNAAFCTPGGTPVTLTASGALTYTWSPTTGLTPTSGSPVAAAPSTTTTYTVTGTDGNGCVNTATSTITVTANPQNVTATATPANICNGNTSFLSSTGTVPFTAKDYVFAAGTGSLDPMAGATTLISSPAVASGAGDDTPTAVQSLGFTFNYEGTNYTQFSISPDGWILLGNETATSQFTNSITSTTNVPKIYALWDDLCTGTNGNVKVLVSGTAPTKVFKAQWLVTNPRSLGSPANATFQVWLYEGTNVIEYRYGAIGTSASASAGLTGSTATNFQSITLSANSASTITANNSNTTAPASGTMYTFTPPPLVSFAWTAATNLVNPSSQNTLTNPLTATETFTVTATSGACSVTADATVTISAGASITTDPVADNKCAGQTATFSVIANGPGLSYQWRKGGININTIGNPSAATATLVLPNVSSADIDTYDVVVSAACGSPVTSAGAALTVTTPLAGIDAPVITVCSGTPVTLTENGGTATSWSWSPGGATTQAITVSPASTTTYTVTATFNGCSATANQTITVDPTPSAVIISPATASICIGSSVGLSVTGGMVTGSSTFNASSGTINLAIPDNSSAGVNHTIAVSGIPAGSTIDSVIVTFNLTHTFSGDAELNLEAPNGQVINLMADRGSSSGAGFVNTRVSSDGTRPAFSTGTNPFTGTFKADATAQGSLIGSPAVTTSTFSSLFSTINGNWIIRAYDDAGSDFGTLSNWSVKIAYTGPVQGTITWDPTSDLSPSTGPNVTANPASTTTYTATSTVGACSSSNTVVVTVNPLPTPVIAGTLAFCAGGSTILDAGSGYSSYSWSNGATTQTISLNTAGTFSVTVTDGNGCSGTSAPVTTIVNPLPTPSITGDLVFCAGTSTTLDAGAGYSTYNWSNGANTQTITVSAAGTFSVTVTDGNGCSGSAAPVTVSVVSLDYYNLQWPPSGTICTGGNYNVYGQVYEAGVTPAPGPGAGITAEIGFHTADTDPATWTNWFPAVFFTQVGNNDEYIATFGNTLSPGTYYYTFRYTFNGCDYQYGGYSGTGGGTWNGTSNVSGQLVVNPAPTPTISGNLVFCSGGSTVLDAGAGYSSYNWSNGANTQTITVSAAGTFSVTVTNSFGCSGTSIAVNTIVNASPTPAITGTLAFCAGSSTILDAGAGYSSYNWSTGATTQTISVNTAGSFSVTVTDGNGCSGTSASVTVIENALPVVSFIGLAATYCTTDAAVTLTGSPVGGTFSGPGITGNSFDPATAGAGTHPITYTYTDPGTGCINSSSQNVTVIVCATFATLNLTAFLEGFHYDVNTMRANIYDLGISTISTETDTLLVGLWAPANLANPSPDYSMQTVVSQNGTCSPMQFPAALVGNAYYIQVKHRNHIETWSANAVTFAATTNYDFTTSQSQAYDDGVDANPPMAAVVGGKFAFYAGDVNQDGGVDGQDASALEIDVNGFAFGYNTSDANGDGSSDGLDASVIEINTNLFIFYSRP